MTRLYKNGSIFLGRRQIPADVLSTGDGVFVFAKNDTADDPRTASGNAGIAGFDPGVFETADEIVDLTGKLIVPGFADVHVHFREPGLSYKETIGTGTAAAAAGGYTVVCPMPNVDPAPDCLESLRVELSIIERDALVRTIPYGTITRPAETIQTSNADGTPLTAVSGGANGPAGAKPSCGGTIAGGGGRMLSAMEEMAPYVCAFSDDGKGVQTGDLMRDAMELAKSLGKLIVAHCEDESLLVPGGCVHDGSYAAAHGLVGISSASEWKQVERDVKLADETGCGYHVCHVSTKESVEIIRDAKASGVDVTCETAPHYLVLTQDDLIDEGRFKMNPPLRERADREALREGIADGTVDLIATDHAPHAAEEKSRGLAKSPFGIVGLEVSFPVLNTELVEKGVISFDRLMELMAGTPRKRFGLPGAEMLDGGSFRAVCCESAGGGCEANVGYRDAVEGKKRIFGDFTVIDPDAEYEIDPSAFKSKGRATPFAGRRVKGRVELTVMNGEVVYDRSREE